LLQVVGGRNAGQEIAVRGRRYLIGRASDCHLRAHSEQISRYHCALLVENPKVYVRDYGSRNGTLVDGVRILDQAELHDGQRLRIGPLEFLVCIRPERSGVAGKDTSHGKAASDTIHAKKQHAETGRTDDRENPSNNRPSDGKAARSSRDASDAVDVLQFLTDPESIAAPKSARREAAITSLDDFLAAERAAAKTGKTSEPAPPEADTSDAALEGLKKIFTPKRH
jgi:predicted component of type VI protein secretion system